MGVLWAGPVLRFFPLPGCNHPKGMKKELAGCQKFLQGRKASVLNVERMLFPGREEGKRSNGFYFHKRCCRKTDNGPEEGNTGPIGRWPSRIGGEVALQGAGG